MEEKIIGILGGMGPEATIDLFSRIVKETNAKSDEEHLRIIIDNNPKIPSRQDAIMLGTESPVPEMVKTCNNLKRAGADVIIIGANTAHYFFEDVSAQVDLPFLNIIDEAIKNLISIAPNTKKIGVLATTAAVKTKLYNKNCDKYDIEVIDLPSDIQELVHNSIFKFKYDGKTNDIVLNMEKAIEYLKNQGSDGIIMGCTEIPIILDSKSYDIPLIDPNGIIAKVAVDYAKNKL